MCSSCSPTSLCHGVGAPRSSARCDVGESAARQRRTTWVRSITFGSPVATFSSRRFQVVRMTVPETVLVFVGIPLAASLLLAVLVYGRRCPERRVTGRVGPGITSLSGSCLRP